MDEYHVRIEDLRAEVYHGHCFAERIDYPGNSNPPDAIRTDQGTHRNQHEARFMITGEHFSGWSPLPIFCRGHSGGRLMCEAFIRNGIAMGNVSPERKDTQWFADTNPKVHRLVMNSLRYPDLPAEERTVWQERTRECIDDFVRREIPGPVPFGWKMGFSLFMMPMVLDAYPAARVVHLIRDGRDVMLSRLNARMDFGSALNRLAVFGDPDVTIWRGEPLTADTVAAYRNELEMQHWVTAVGFGLRGRAYGSRYPEVRYEDICANPIAQFERIFEILDVPFIPPTQAWLTQSVHVTRVGKNRVAAGCALSDSSSSYGYKSLPFARG